MVFCAKCGKELALDSKFCSQCGTPVDPLIPGEHVRREQVYVGVAKKCPVCGEELPSMAAVCPACGHEINSTQVHPALQKLIDELALCEQSIAGEEVLASINDEKETARGWHSWSAIAKTIWIIVNCLTLCVPAVVYYLFRSRIRTQKFQKSAPSVKQKANLIENFQIPSERQAIIESLYFICDKVSALAAQKVTSDTTYWAKLWDVKGGQIYKKAQTAIPDDITVSGLYHEISSSVQQVKVASKRKNIFSGLITVLYIVAVIAIEVFVINRISQIANIPGASSSLPIIWGFCAALLLAFFVWTVKKIPDNLKKGITVAICVAALFFSAKSFQNSAADFTTKIGSKCSDNNMILSGVDMNVLTKVASIKIQSPAYDKSTIDKAEAELFSIAREYKFELKIVFVDKDNFTIRGSQIGKYGAVKHSPDNTNGIIEFIKEKCAKKGAKLDQIENYYDNVIELCIQVPAADRSAIMDTLQQEIFATRTQFGYSEYKIEFRTMGKYSGDLLRTIEIGTDGSISVEERVLEFNQAMVDETLTRAIAKCKEEKIDMVIEMSDEHWELLWKSFIDTNGNQTNVDVYHFRIEAQEICEKNGATIDSMGMSNREMHFYVYADSRRRGKIDKMEEELINAYKTHSDLMEMSIYFVDVKQIGELGNLDEMDLELSEWSDRWDKIHKDNTIRDTEVDASGTVSRSNDNTTLF